MKPSARYLVTFAAGFLTAVLLHLLFNALHPAPPPASSDIEGKGFLFDGLRPPELPLTNSPGFHPAPTNRWK